jgi:hypothetical protein
MVAVDPSKQIDKLISDLSDWRGEVYSRLRKIVRDADPKISEEWKWGTAVWSHAGLVVAVGAFKGNVKMNFFQGASIPDPHRLFNAGLEAKKTRAIDFHEGDRIDEPALKSLIRAAVAYNSAGQK